MLEERQEKSYATDGIRVRLNTNNTKTNGLCLKKYNFKHTFGFRIKRGNKKV